MSEPMWKDAMHTVAGPGLQEYQAAIALAVRAPSLHNSKSWRWTVGPEGLELRADRTRQLTATDMDRHGLLLGCGAALHLACLGLEAQGWSCEVERLPDPRDPDMLAQIRPTVRTAVTPEVRRRATAASHRYSQRRPFDPRPVSGAVLEDLRRAARASGVYLHFVQRADERLDLAMAVSWANRYVEAAPRAPAEWQRWVRADDSAPDGFPAGAGALPHLVGGRPWHTEVPVRDVDRSGVAGTQLICDLIDEQPVFAILFTVADGHAARMRAGEAMARVFVRAAELGLASSLISQPVDLPSIRARVRVLMSWPDHPQMVMRLGWPLVGPPGPRTGRRGVDEISTVGTD